MSLQATRAARILGLVLLVSASPGALAQSPQPWSGTQRGTYNPTLPAAHGPRFSAENVQPVPTLPIPTRVPQTPHYQGTGEGYSATHQPVSIPTPRDPGLRWRDPNGLIMPAAAQLRPRESDLQVQLEPPGPNRLFGKLESEEGLLERIRQQGRDEGRTDQALPPELPPLSTEVGVARNWPHRHLYVEPNYLCYDRLYFEQKNGERYGWDLGWIDPLVATLAFYKDVAMIPYNFAKDPCRHYECNAGYCLPGDPVPYLLYPPGFSVPGTIAETGIILALFAIFP